MALHIEYDLRERTRLVSYSGCLPWVNESQCFTYLIYKVHEISSNNRVSLIIKSGIYAEILTSNDAWWAEHVMLNASHTILPEMLVLQMQLNNLRCVSVRGRGERMVFY